MRDFQPLSYQADRCAAEPRSARFFSIAKLFRPSQSERRMRDVSTTPCGARSAELGDTDTPKESDTSCGACVVSARREPRPAAPRSPRRSQLFHHLYHSSHHFAPAISALCSQAQYARFPASLLRSRQKCSRAAERANSLQLPAERAARSWQTGCKKESDTSCGACAVSARREPRPAAPRSPRRSQLFHHLYHSSHHFAPAISALCSQAQYARFPASLLRSRQKCSRAAERANSLQLPAERAARSWQAGRKKRIRDKLRSVRSHGPAPAKATHSPIIHFQFPIPTPISVLFSSVLLFLRRMKSTGAHKPFYSIESRTHLK